MGDLRIVKLFKEADAPLGATVRNEGEAVVVTRIVKGGVAERSGLLHEGDEVLEVNGIEVRGRTVNEVCELMANMKGEVTMIICPSQLGRPRVDHSKAVLKHVRAMFDYDPDEDAYLPCKELGQGFRRGDILHVISAEDPDWWQAYRDEGDGDCLQSLAGLIPSATFQTRRLQLAKEADEEERAAGLICAGAGRRKKTKSRGDAGAPGDAAAAPPAPYEEVTMFLPRTGRRRPVVLVGPAHAGCPDLRQRLMDADGEKFAGVVPVTSRPPRPGETDGVHFKFVSRAKFKDDVAAGKFLEWGHFQKDFYGTTLESVRCLVDKGRTCVLVLRPQSLKTLRETRLMPFVVFVSPPSLEKLKLTRSRAPGPPLTDAELRNVIQEGKLMEERYGHFFDRTITNGDPERAYKDLRQVIHRVETEPDWVPVAWLRGQDSDAA